MFLPITGLTIRLIGVHGEGRVTISSYQVDGIIKAYNKQSRLKVKSSIPQGNREDKYADVVTLSVGRGPSDAAYKAISYNLLDIILNSKER
jgi:hypothetical protein